MNVNSSKNLSNATNNVNSASDSIQKNKPSKNLSNKIKKLWQQRIVLKLEVLKKVFKVKVNKPDIKIAYLFNSMVLKGQSSNPAFQNSIQVAGLHPKYISERSESALQKRFNNLEKNDFLFREGALVGSFDVYIKGQKDIHVDVDAEGKFFLVGKKEKFESMEELVSSFLKQANISHINIETFESEDEAIKYLFENPEKKLALTRDLETYTIHIKFEDSVTSHPIKQEGEYYVCRGQQYKTIDAIVSHYHQLEIDDFLS